MKRATRIVCLVIAAIFIAVTLISVFMSIANAEGLDYGGTRGETVYVEADANGNPLSMISSVYISNPDKAQSITDYTTLTDIKNISGSEAPVIEGDAVTFAADGEDVCYQGTASGQLPFSVSVAYYLDGAPIAPGEIAGKSGKVRIEVKSANNLMREAMVDGEMMELYVPFSVICMMTLDDSFTAVSAEGAKLSAQAGQITILSVLLPGLAESLDAQEGDRIRDSFVVEADAKSFELGSMMFVGMTGIIDENDLTGIDDIEGLLNALSDISAASTELYRGAKSLRNGLEGFTDGFSLYASGVSDASEGTRKAADGAGELSAGMDELNDGTWQVAASVDQIASALDQARDQLNAATDPDAEVDEATSQMIRDAINAAVRENAQEIEDQLAAALDARLAPYIPDETIRQAIVEGVIADLDLDSFEVDVSDEMIKNIRNAILATQQTQEMLTMLNELADGAQELSRGAGQLAVGSDKINDALKELAKGISELADGLDELDANGETMLKALKSLTRGSRALTDGLKALSEDGLKSVVDETDKLGVSLSRKDALLSLAEEYTSFTCTKPQIGDTVQFMFTTEEIIAEAPIENTPGVTDSPGAQAGNEGAQGNDESFFQRVGDWFSDVFESIKGWFA